MSEESTVEDRPARTDEHIAEKFPDRGEFPGNKVVVKADAPEAPNKAHPH